MRPTGISERKKKMAAFAGLYIASIILLLFIFSAFGWHRIAEKTEQKKYTGSNAAQLDKELLHADSLLHTEMFEVEMADRYYSMLADSGRSAERGNALVNTFNAVNAIQKTIDSVEQMTSYYKGDLGARYNAMLNTFKSSLRNRLLLKNTKEPATANAKSATAIGTGDMFSWKNELQLKDDEIARLKATIKNLQSADQYPSATAGKTEAQKGETDLLKTAFNDLQKDFDVLKDKYNRLKTENNNTLIELADVKKIPAQAVEKTSNVNDSRVSKLQQQVEDLNTALYFSKIDCNLVRSDAHQIISNSRQRKELLLESLEMLNNLSKSGDATIQKKAKEKIERLNQIANTLHD